MISYVVDGKAISENGYQRYSRGPPLNNASHPFQARTVNKIPCINVKYGPSVEVLSWTEIVADRLGATVLSVPR